MAVQATYFDGKSAKSHDVSLTDNGTELIIWGADTERQTWSIKGLHPVDPPSPGQPYRLTHQDAPGARLIIRDQAFIDALVAHSKHLKGGYSKTDIAHLLGWTFGGIAVFALLGWVAIAVLPEPVAHLLPQSWRQRTGVEMEKTMAGGKAPCSNPAGERALGLMLANLAEGNPDMPPVSVHVYDLNMVNAFAVTGGHVIVTKQLIDTADKPEEVAGVIAHEIGHVSHLHPEEQTVRLAGVQILSSLFSGTNGGTWSSNGLFVASVMRQSRENEEEADAYARDMLQKAQIDPMGLKFFFGKLLKREGKQKTGITALDDLDSMFSTHPGTEERMNKITPLPDGTVPKPALSADDWAALKKICS